MPALAGTAIARVDLARVLLVMIWGFRENESPARFAEADRERLVNEPVITIVEVPFPPLGMRMKLGTADILNGGPMTCT